MNAKTWHKKSGRLILLCEINHSGEERYYELGTGNTNCHEYEMDGNINIEMYSCGDTSSADYYSEIWLPVRKMKGSAS